MAYNEKLANQTRELISLTHKNVEEKKMFGGLCFMVNGKMCVGVEQERLMVRFDPLINLSSNFPNNPNLTVYSMTCFTFV